MSLPPAGWFDDPERPDTYRYWDGAEWTDHRAPKSAPAMHEDNSGIGIVSSGWELFKAHWVPMLAIGALTWVGIIVGAALIISALLSALDPSVLDIADRVFDPRFNADTNPGDQAYLDSIKFNLTTPFAVLGVLGALIASLSILVGSGTSTLFLGAAHTGERVDPSTCFGIAVRRLPRWIGIALLWAVMGVLPLVLLWLLAIITMPLLLIGVIPLTAAVVVYLFPAMTIAGAGLLLGPVDRPPFRTALALVKGQWRTVAMRVLVVNLILAAINIGLGVVNLIPVIGILINLAGQFVYYSLQTATAVKLYASVEGQFADEIAPNSGV
jgi:hypothetical protein